LRAAPPFLAEELLRDPPAAAREAVLAVREAAFDAAPAAREVVRVADFAAREAELDADFAVRFAAFDVRRAADVTVRFVERLGRINFLAVSRAPPRLSFFAIRISSSSEVFSAVFKTGNSHRDTETQRWRKEFHLHSVILILCVSVPLWLILSGTLNSARRARNENFYRRIHIKPPARKRSTCVSRM
jgi:hypothetical protein